MFYLNVTLYRKCMWNVGKNKNHLKYRQTCLYTRNICGPWRVSSVRRGGGRELQLRDDIWAPKTMLRFICHAPVEQLPYRTATYCCILYGAMRWIYHSERKGESARERERESQLASQAKVLKFKCPKIPIPIPFFCVGQRPVCVSCHAYATCAATRQDSKIALGAHFLDQCS